MGVLERGFHVGLRLGTYAGPLEGGWLGEHGANDGGDDTGDAVVEKV